MNEDETSASVAAAPAGNGFRISDAPVVATHRAATERFSDGLPVSYDQDLLYVVARDPKSLFLYWDLHWARVFAAAGVSTRAVHLRIYRADGSIEGTQEVNPFRGHCYADVTAPGLEYYGELGCFEGDEWKALARSGPTATPESSMSDDLEAEFATLPIHLSFQRLLDIFRSPKSDRATLARSVALLQENARVLQDAIALDDWPRLASAVAASLNGRNTAPGELSELLEMALQGNVPTTPTADELTRWKELGERFGASSWGGASGGSGGSSPA